MHTLRMRCGGGLAVQLRRPIAAQSICAAGKSLRQKSGDFCHLPFQGRRGCWLGYGFTAYILTCLKTRKKDLRTFGKPLVVRYERAGLMAPLQRGRPHAYFTYAMWRGLAVQLRRPLAVQSICAAGKSLRQKSGDFCHLPFQGRRENARPFYSRR